MNSDLREEALRALAAKVDADAAAMAANQGGKTINATEAHLRSLGARVMPEWGDEPLVRPIGSTHKLDAATEEKRINATLDMMFRLRHRAYPPALVVFAHGRRQTRPLLFDARGDRV